MGTTRRVAIYVRVSTDGQTTMNQQRELEAVAKRQGWKVVELFRDQGISGKNGREKPTPPRRHPKGLRHRCSVVGRPPGPLAATPLRLSL
jgi:hypothetical protein